MHCFWNLSCELIAGEINVFQKAHFFISMALQKKSKNILSIFKISKERDNNTFCPFSQFLRKGTKRDIKVFKIHQNFWFFMSLFVPFPTNFGIKIGILSVFKNILSLFVLSLLACHGGKGREKGDKRRQKGTKKLTYSAKSKLTDHIFETSQRLL